MVAGVEGDDFVRGSRLLFKNYGGLRLMTQSVANVGARATDISFGNTECTIEGFYVEDPSGLSRLYVNNNPFNPNMSTSMPLVTFSGPAPSDYFMVPIGTEFLADTGLYSLSSTTYPVAQKKTHIMLSWASNILSYYVNGRLVHSGLFAVMNKAWTTVMIGGLTGSPAGASLMPVGEIAQVRISNIARTKSYAQAAYNTLLAM
jgi:hypothetical protein